MGSYELIEHDADIGIRVMAPTIEELFSTAGKAFFSILCDPTSIEAKSVEAVALEEESLEDLMVAWLSELLYLHSTKRFLGSEISDVKIERTAHEIHLTASASGETYDPERHEILEEIKTVTYHGLTLTEQNNTWICEVILDV